jgi:hypothetical protein
MCETQMEVALHARSHCLISPRVIVNPLSSANPWDVIQIWIVPAVLLQRMLIRRRLNWMQLRKRLLLAFYLSIPHASEASAFWLWVSRRCWCVRRRLNMSHHLGAIWMDSWMWI